MSADQITINFCECIFEACPWAAPASYKRVKADRQTEEFFDSMREMDGYEAATPQQKANLEKIFGKAKKHMGKESA